MFCLAAEWPLDDCLGYPFDTSQWRHNGRDGVSNHQHHHCLLNLLFRRRSKCFHLMTSSWKMYLWIYNSNMIIDNSPEMCRVNMMTLWHGNASRISLCKMPLWFSPLIFELCLLVTSKDRKIVLCIVKNRQNILTKYLYRFICYIIYETCMINLINYDCCAMSIDMFPGMLIWIWITWHHIIDVRTLYGKYRFHSPPRMSNIVNHSAPVSYLWTNSLQNYGCPLGKTAATPVL